MKNYFRILRSQAQPFRFLAARLLAATGLSRLILIKLPGYKLRFYPSNITINLWINPHVRTHGLELFRDYPKPGDVIVDVGSNIGETTILSSLGAGQSGRVFAFEPVPKVFRFLEGNLRLNACTNVHAFNLALGEQEGKVRMSDSPRDDMNLVSSEGSVEASMKTVDTMIPPEVSPALLKVDVEGFELNVLRGAGSTLRRTRCVCCEMGEAHAARFGYRMKDLIGFLADFDFQTFVIAGHRKLVAISPEFNSAFGEELIALKDPMDFAQRTGWTVDQTKITSRP